MSSTELVAEYLAERARPAVFVPLALLVAGTGSFVAPGPSLDPLSFAIRAAQALLLILALRVWDDVQDRARDAMRHPRRVTVRARTLAPLVGLSAAFAATGALWLLQASVPLLRFTIFAAVGLGLLVWYRVRPARPSRIASAALLAKYPALAILLAPDLGDLSPIRAAIGAGALYAIACTYEFMEDRFRGPS
jgi:hypothetical protein